MRTTRPCSMYSISWTGRPLSCSPPFSRRLNPIAVLALFRQMRVKERISNIIEGESLFNVGVAGSLFQTFLALVLLSAHRQALTGLAAVGNGFLLFVEEAGGGIVLGFVVGFGMSQCARPP
ncbi:MAG: cation:proton antiporter [Ktedonobacteraceae bacterium]